MEKVLYFLSNYNAQIIQAGFAVVFLLIIIYVYRAFFMAGSLSGETADVAHSPAIEQKLNQILEIQRSKSGAVAPSSSGAVAPSGGGSAPGTSSPRGQNAEEEIDKLKAEIYNLRQQLNDAEKVSAVSGGQNLAPFSAVNSNEDAVENDPASSKATEQMVVKVKELESRLSEYEIIADDIAELSQLRADNAKLKEQLSKVQGSAPAAAEILEPKPVAAATEELSAQAAIDALFASATADLPSDPVAANEQDLINEFEKKTQKKDDE